MAEVKMNSHLEEISSIGPSRTAEEALESEERPKRTVPTADVQDIVKVEEPEHSFIGRIFRALFSTDFKTAQEHVIYDVVVPGIQDGLVNAVVSIVETMVYGESKPKKATSYRRGNTTYYSYDKVDKPSYERGSRFTIKTRRDYPGWDDEPMSVNKRGGRYFDDIPFNTKEDVETLIDILMDHIDAKGFATVLDLYAALDPPRRGQYTDAGYGWTKLGGAKAVPRQGVWYLSLPPVEVVKGR